MVNAQNVNDDYEIDTGVKNLYMVHSVRFSPDVNEDGTMSMEYAVLGVCETMEKALQCADAHRLLDSTLLEMPTISVFPAVSVNDYTIGIRLMYMDGTLLVQSRVMVPGDEYYVTHDDNHYNALVDPDKLDIFIDDAKKWHWDTIGGELHIDYMIPNDALTLLDA